jgi:hypothetical protein
MRTAPSHQLVCGLAFTVALLGGAIFAEPVKATPTIRLKTYSRVRVPDRTLGQVQQAVTFIFKRIGVKTEWVTDAEPQLRVFIVDTMVDPAVSSEDIFGHAPRDPDGTSSGMAYVSYSRIQEFIRSSEPQGYPPLDIADILTYFIAHEIGHMLLPAGSHTPTGIMRARWRATDFKLMGKSYMSFTPEQEKLIRIQACRLSQNC